MTSFCHAVPLSDLTSVSEARRLVQQVGNSLHLSEVKLGQAAIIVTEAARNAVMHGKGGHLLITGYQDHNQPRMQILALDSGSGIADMSRAMKDGYSTSGTPGTGMGAIQRLAGTFEIFSSSKGTAVFAEVAERPMHEIPLLDAAGFTVPIRGERVCGDAIDWSQGNDRFAVTMVDGLGHGLHASEAAEEAVNIFQKYATEPPHEIIARMHDSLKKTRGAAAAVAEIRPLSGTLTFAGVGNISAVVISKALSRNLVSHSGTLGHVMSRIQEFKVEWPRDAILVMHSDGLQTRWELTQYPGLMTRNPALIAGVLFRDFRRERDDAGVLVVKNRSAAS